MTDSKSPIMDFEPGCEYMEPAFKKSRSVGQLPELYFQGRPKEQSFWGRLKHSNTIPHDGPVTSVDFSTRDLIVGSSIRVSMRKDDAGNYEKARSIFKLEDNVQKATFRADGRLVAISSVTGEIVIVDPQTKMVLRNLKGHKASVRALNFLPNKTHLVSSSDDSTVRIWEIATGTEVWCSHHHTDLVRAVASSKNYFASGSYDHTACVWDSYTSVDPLLCVNHGSPIEAVAVIDSAEILVTAGISSVKLWNIRNGSLEKEIIVHHKTITALHVTVCEKYLLTASLDHSVKVVDLTSFALAHQFKFPAAVLSLGVSFDRKRLAAGLSNGNLVTLSYREVSKESKIVDKNKQRYLAEESYTVLRDQSASLKTFDRLLKSFKYREAFDYVVRRNLIHLFASAVGELIRRNALTTAISGRTEAEIIPVVDMICSKFGSSRHVSMLLEIGFAIIEIYGPIIGKSEFFDSTMKKLQMVLGDQIKVQRSLMDLQGYVEILKVA